MKDFRFSCTACGACCNRPPQFYIDEIVEQSRNFVLSGGLVAYGATSISHEGRRAVIENGRGVDPSVDPEGFSHSVKAYFSESQSFGVPIGKTGMAVLLEMSSIEDLLEEGCPQVRADGRCNVYNDRPVSCRSAPIDRHLSGKYRVDALRKLIDEGRKNWGFKCDTSDSAPILLDEAGKIQDPEFRDAWLQDKKIKSGLKPRAIKAVTQKIYREARKTYGLNDDEMVMKIVSRSVAHSSVSVDGLSIIASGVAANVWGLEDIMQICDNQIRKINEFLADLDPDTPSPYTLFHHEKLFDQLISDLDRYRGLFMIVDSGLKGHLPVRGES